MRQLTSFLVATSLFAVMGCTQPAPVKTTKSGVITNPAIPTPPAPAPTKPAEKPPEKPAEKPAEKAPEKPGDKTPPPPPK
ncbi:MAG: hypothetical protein QM703_00430 [Gemmatales bacterium]